MMEKAAIVEKLTHKIAELQKISPEALDPETQLLESGTIDSYATLELTIFVEDTFGLPMDEERLAQLGTIEAIAGHISASA